MSYTLQAIIGSPDSFGPATAAEHFASVEMRGGLRMIPLTTHLRKRYGIPFLPLTDAIEGEQGLPQQLDSLCRELAGKGLVTYLEADFFGGSGIQAYALFKDGAPVGSPIVAERAINQALGTLGVQKDGYQDEFAALELGRYRNTDDWATEQSSTGAPPGDYTT